MNILKRLFGLSTRDIESRDLFVLSVDGWKLCCVKVSDDISVVPAFKSEELALRYMNEKHIGKMNVASLNTSDYIKAKNWHKDSGVNLLIDIMD
jgi:hypothetical protein